MALSRPNDAPDCRAILMSFRSRVARDTAIALSQDSSILAAISRTLGGEGGA